MVFFDRSRDFWSCCQMVTTFEHCCQMVTTFKQCCQMVTTFKQHCQIWIWSANLRICSLLGAAAYGGPNVARGAGISVYRCLGRPFSSALAPLSVLTLSMNITALGQRRKRWEIRRKKFLREKVGCLTCPMAVFPDPIKEGKQDEISPWQATATCSCSGALRAPLQKHVPVTWCDALRAPKKVQIP